VSSYQKSECFASAASQNLPLRFVIQGMTTTSTILLMFFCLPPLLSRALIPTSFSKIKPANPIKANHHELIPQELAYPSQSGSSDHYLYCPRWLIMKTLCISLAECTLCIHRLRPNIRKLRRLSHPIISEIGVLFCGGVGTVEHGHDGEITTGAVAPVY
jgi:hypothetical protein